MLYVKDQFATVWKTEEGQGNFSLVQMSTSRKDKKTGDYLNSSWGFVRFVAEAHDKIDLLSKGTRIVIKAMGISREPYVDKNGDTVYPKNPQMAVFNFELSEAQSGNKGVMDTAPQVGEDNPEDIPF